MSYIRAEEVLPDDVLAIVQKYVEGQMIYIPKKFDRRRAWGERTDTKKNLELRNARIYDMYCNGTATKEIAAKFFLTEKSVQRIIRNIKPSKKICNE